MTASPTAPPRLRVRLKRPDAFLTCCGGKVPSAALVIGTMHSMSEAPRRICGINSSSNAQSLVTNDACQVPKAKPTRPVAIITRGSILVDSLPTMGADRNIAMPVKNIVSPICIDE